MGAKLPQLCLTLCNPMHYSLSCSSVHGILQARILELIARQGIFPIQGLNLHFLMSSALVDKFLTTTATWEAPPLVLNLIKEKKNNLLIYWIPDTRTPQQWEKYALTGLSELIQSDDEGSESHLPGLTCSSITSWLWTYGYLGIMWHHFIKVLVKTKRDNIGYL